MSPQNLCNLVWSAVTLDVAAEIDPDMMEEVARQSLLKLPEMPAQSVSNLLWAFAKMNIRLTAPPPRWTK